MTAASGSQEPIEADGSDRKLEVTVAALQKAVKRRHAERPRRKGNGAFHAQEVPSASIEDLQEAAEYLLEEVDAQGVVLPEPDSNSRAPSDDRGSFEAAAVEDYDLKYLESHPLHALVCSTLHEVLGFDEASARDSASLVVEEMLEGLSAPTASVAEVQSKRHEKGTLGSCELCTRRMPLTAHHLIPKSEHDRLLKQVPAPFSLNEMRTRFAWLCRPCHSAVHKLVDSRAMADEYNTLEKLEELESVQRWAKYASGLKERAAGYEGFGLRNKR